MKYSFEDTSDFHHSVIEYKTDGSINYHEFGNMFIPGPFEFWYLHGLPVEHDPSNTSGWQQPEARYSVGFDYRVKDGNASFMHFGFYKIFEAGLFLEIDTQPNQQISASVWCHAWSSTDDDPYTSDDVGNDAFSESVNNPSLTDAQKNIAFWIGIDPFGGTNPYSESIIWGEGKHIYNIFDQIAVNTLSQSNKATIFIKTKSLWPFKHNDVYIDLLEIDTEESDCWGIPREQYQRTYYLLPQSATQEQVAQVQELAYPTKSTVGFSADDAGLGALNNKTANVISFSKTDWNKQDIRDFYLTYYPQTQVEFTDLYKPTPNPLISNNFIGLHSGYEKPGWDNYFVSTLSNVQKVFSCGFAYSALMKSPDALIVWRKFAESHVDCVPPLRENAIKLVDFYSGELLVCAESKGLTEEQLVDTMEGVVLESLNEKIPTYNPPQLHNAVQFDAYFCEELYNRYGGKLRPGILTAAVGNPHESEVVDLIPAVEAAIQYNGLIAYHAYWAANQERTFIDEHWKYHAGRWQEWDKTFNEYNLYPSYYFGECGICYAQDGWSFQPFDGWKNCGSFEKYLIDIQTFNTNISNWNALNNNRCYGGTLFGYGNWGWEYFEIGEGDLLLLTNAANQWK